MRPITFHLCFALFSLVAASTYPSDAKDPFTNPTVSSNAPDPDELENHVHSTLEDLHVGCPTDEHYPFHPSNTQFSPPHAGSHTMVVGITVILLVSVVWPVWRCMGDDAQDGHLAHRAGRSDAVSALALASHEGGLRHHDNSIGSKPRRRLSAAVVSSDVPCYHTPPPLCWTIHPPAPISEEPEDDCAVANPQRSATPRIHALQRVAVAGRHTLRTWSWPPTNRSTRTVVCLCVPPPDPCSLRRSLHKGARDLGDEPLELDRCMIIVVGVDTPNHEDAENDAKYLQKMFESSTRNFLALRYECIYGPNATRVKIREAVRTLIGEAQAMPVPPRMFMWFTGTGDHNNAMCLPNDETLSESDLGDLLFSLADQTNKPVISTLFDICRPAAPRLATILQCVEMAWSCSVGQLACALLLPKQEDKLLPRSTFLLAIFLAAHHTNIHGQDERFFEADFAFHINQLSGYVQFRYHQLHRERCPHCPADKPCDPPVAQNPDLQHAGRAITTLGMLIANHFPEHAYEVFVAVGRRMKEKGFPRRLCPLSDSLATQAVRSSTRGDGSYLDSRTASRAKVRFASVEAEPLPRVV